jgi:hypothetical protein
MFVDPAEQLYFYARLFFAAACVEGLGTTWRISQNSSPLGANIILGLIFRTNALPMVVDQIVSAVTEHVHRTTTAVIHSAGFPAMRHTQLLHCKNFNSDVPVYNDEILLKSSL